VRDYSPEDNMEYDVIYSDRKSIGIKVKNGNVTVRAPRGTKITHIEDVVKKHIKWIENALEREKNRREMYKEPDESQINDLKRQAKAYFEEKCAYYAKIMNLKYEKLNS
jgi:predicted metal-dependent hydrolase